MQFKSFMEALKGKQHKIDKNKNGQIDAHDFKLLRKEESEESAETIEESEERMARADYKTGPSGRKSHKEIVFNDAESKDDEEEEDKKEMKEAKMSDADMAERERIVKGMKKNLSGFKARYGKDAKSVMYATATKQAMKEETVEEAVQKADIPAYLRKQQGQTPLKLSDLKRKDTISDKENLAKLRNEELDESVFADKEQAQAMASKLKAKHEDGNYSVVADHGKHRVVHSYHSDSRVKKDIAKLNEELDEAMVNGREYASHGLMHPDHAASALHKVTGQSIDFYAHGTGDKVEGKVTKNDGKAVHIKDTKGTTHKFKVQRGLPQQQNEEKKDDVPFDGPYTKTKPAKNSDGTPQAPMSRARELAKQAMKKQMKEDIDRLFEKDDSEYNYEGEMAVTQLKTIIRHAEALQAKMQPDTNLPEWVQSKITLATDYIQTASDYLHSELEEQAPVAPVPDRKYIRGTPEHKAYKATKKPINGMPTGNMKESFDSDGNIVNSKVSYKDFAMMLEYETKDGVYKHKGTYGGSYTDPEGADDADDKKPKQQPAEKRGRGRPAGAKSGARKITGTSKLFK
jgi:hypothetical protein